jgi:aldose 1-epimerase
MIISLKNSYWQLEVDAKGARVISLGCIHQQKKIKLISSHSDLNSWNESVWMFPWSNSLKNGSYTFDGIQYVNMQQDPLHGLLKELDFSVLKVSDHQCCLQYEFQNDGISLFPFAVGITITFTLKNKNFNVKIEVQNNDLIFVPYSIGWHPYFELEAIGDSPILCLQEVKKSTWSLTNDVPTFNQSKESIDLSAQKEINALFALNQGSLYLEGTQGKLNISTKGFNYLQVFKSMERNALAIEPMTSCNSALNNGIGLKELAPNTSEKFEIELTFES